MKSMEKINTKVKRNEIKKDYLKIEIINKKINKEISQETSQEISKKISQEIITNKLTQNIKKR